MEIKLYLQNLHFSPMLYFIVGYIYLNIFLIIFIWKIAIEYNNIKYEELIHMTDDGYSWV